MGIQKDIIEAEVRLKGMSESQRQLVELSSSYGTLAEKNKMLRHQMLELESQGRKGTGFWCMIRDEIKKNQQEMGVLDAKMGMLNSKLKYSEMTHKQLQKAQKDLQRELSRTSKELDPKKWNELNSKMKDVELQMGKTKAGASSTQKWMGDIKEGFKSLLPAAGLTAGIALLKSAFSSILSLSKQMQGDAVRSSVVLGDQLGYVESQADKLAAKMGLTNREFVAATAATADLLVPLGFTRDASSKMATQVTSLSGALNEWTGGSYGVEEVSKRLQKAVLGETDSLKELGISIRLDSDEYKKSVKQKMEVQKVTQEQAQAMTIMEMLYQKSTDAQTAYAQNGNRILRFQNSLNVWWKTLKESVASYITTSSDQRLLKSADAIIKQGEEVEKTNKHIGDLLSRYEELKKKGKLSREEQVELNKSIKELAEFAPGAITQVDAYGNAMGVSAGKIREAMEAQRLLNKEKQKGAIEELNNSVTRDSAIEGLRGDRQLANIAKSSIRSAIGKKNYFSHKKKGEYTPGINTSNEEMVAGATKQLTSGQTQLKKANENMAQKAIMLKEMGQTVAESAKVWGMSEYYLQNLINNYMNGKSSESGGELGVKKNDSAENKHYSLNNDSKYLQEKLKVKQRFRDGDIKDEEEYQKALVTLEIKYLEQRLSSGKDKGKDRLDLQNELADKQIQKSSSSSKSYSLNNDEAYINDVLDIKKKFRDGDIKDEDEYQSQLLALEVKYLKERLDANKDKGKERLDLENALADKELQLKKNAKETAEKLQEKNNKADVDSIQDYFENRERLYNQDIANLKASYQKQIEAARNNKDERKRLITQQKDEENKLAKEFVDDTLRILEQLQNSGAVPDLALIDSILSEDEKDELKKRIKDALDEKSKLSSGGATDEDVKGALKTPEAKEADILGYTPDDWRGLINNLKEGTLGINEMTMGVNALMCMYQAYGNLMTQIENRQLKNIEKSNNKKKAQLKKQLDSKTISEKQYNDRVAQMDQELDEKKAELQQKQARREKALGIMGAIVNTAVGITKMLNLPWPLNLVMSAIVGAMGAVQIATIAAQPIPGKASGGFLVQREQDGKYFDAEFQPKKRGFIGRPTVIVGEGDGPEWVANDKAVANPTVAPILSIFDEAQRNGSIATIDMNRVLAERFNGRASGGNINGAPLPSSPVGVDNNITDVILKFANVTDKLEQRLRKPISACVSMTGKDGLNDAISKFNNWKEDVNL